MKQNFAEMMSRLSASHTSWQGERADGRYLCPEFPVPKVLNGRGMRPGKQSWQGPYPRPPLPNVNSYLTRDAIDKEQLSTGTVFRPTQNLIYQE
ncbi:hypothetical protein Q8A67_012867 [Cirrhinus molitorella]|uniref:Uncharacterized protein n=1 Tax=Cirrhinus molitorella TaxID=172907 RepID=A0AA88TWA2_9TELE|nr:hypothetical protein Q8A67_012867 [Cirrhinus molitorella]